jgi:serine/threonine protein kinase, bacterial
MFLTKLVANQLLNNQYRIIRPLASGGFGDTFLAMDMYTPSQRYCVIKQLQQLHENEQITLLVQERFKREAVILEKLGKGHSQIPDLYAYFCNQQDQQFYLIQEWVEGNTLGKIIFNEGRLGEAKVRRLLIAILPVFDYIHSKSIIHRDVKPDNIILRSCDQQPVLIDFGAVREIMKTSTNLQIHSTQSIVIGTPGYMASEQLIGRPVYSSDFYSLGLTAIYLLTGKHPQEFTCDPDTGEIIWQSDAPKVSAELAHILTKATASHSRDRYQTAGEFLAAMQATSIQTPKLVTIPSNKKIPSSTNLFFIGVLAVAAIISSAVIKAVFFPTAMTIIRKPVSNPSPLTSTAVSPSPIPTNQTPAKPSIKIQNTKQLDPTPIVDLSNPQTVVTSTPAKPLIKTQNAKQLDLIPIADSPKPPTVVTSIPAKPSIKTERKITSDKSDLQIRSKYKKLSKSQHTNIRDGTRPWESRGLVKNSSQDLENTIRKEKQK